MLSYDDALKIILSDAKLLNIHPITLDKALGHIAAENIYAKENLPPFHNSAMDGFAVKSNALLNATKNTPTLLNVAGYTMAGDNPAPQSEYDNKSAWEIMTGAPVPKGYDAVIPIEDIVILESNEQDRPTKISIAVTAFPEKNIRRAGSDFSPEDLLVEKGDEIAAHHIMALSALGHDQISVLSEPHVAVISTGKELVDDLNETLKPGQIRNCNGPYLLNSLRSFGVIATNEGTIFDEEEKFNQKISDLLSKNYSLIVSSGAVSMGRHDFVPDGLRALGAEILFHKTAIRPGKPILFARFPNGIYYFGLPGNPVAAAVGQRFFIYPLLRALRGQPQEKPTKALLSHDFSKESAFRFFQKAAYHHDEMGHLKVTILPGQESFKIKPMLNQNCWAMIPENIFSLKAGSLVDLYPLMGSEHRSAFL
ncbi:MAG: molybdopterin molybdotransferase MoeA [Emcibacter sp.]|nr:molybdopterin molybdotransferase MoeA [Emcibacter sp.]